MPAVLRRVFRRLGLEGFAVGGVCEAPCRAVVREGDIGPALHRLALGEIGDRIVAADGDTVDDAGVNGRRLRLLRLNRQQCERRGNREC